MKLYEVLIQDSETKQMHDITDIIISPSISSEFSSPDELKFSIVDVELPLNEGSTVRFKMYNTVMFYGYIFKKSCSSERTIEVTAYGQKRYLKNKDSIVFPAQTASERFAQICKLCGLKYEIKSNATHKLKPEVCDDKTYWEMIESALDNTLIATGKMYIIRDIEGVLTFADVEDLKTTFLIGDESLAFDYTFETSIDDDTYNSVKIVQDNKETKKRDVYLVQDSSNQAKWGKLQYFEKAKEKMTVEQIKEKAEAMLKIKNRVSKSLKVTCYGLESIGIGNGVIIALKRLKDLGVPYEGYYIVTKCTHNFDAAHTMDLELHMGV